MLVNPYDDAKHPLRLLQYCLLKIFLIRICSGTMGIQETSLPSVHLLLIIVVHKSSSEVSKITVVFCLLQLSFGNKVLP